MNRARRFAVLFIGAAVAAGTPSVIAPISLAQAGETAKVDASAKVTEIFALLSKSPGLFARFSEQRKIALLVSPLKSEGTVHFDRKKGLARHTTAPKKQSLLLAGSELTFWDGVKTEHVRLDGSPALRAFAEGFSMLLSADRAGLEKSFEFELVGNPKEDWTLTLAPKSAELKNIVKAIVVKGRGEVFTSVDVQEKNGDNTLTTFSNVDVRHAYSEEEALKTFRVPPI